MDLIRQILLAVHLIGFAALFGGTLVQVRVPNRRVNPAMRDGAGTTFLAGLALVGVLEAGDGTVNHAKIAVKLVVGLIVLGLVMANVRKERLADGVFFSIFALTLINLGVAVFWSPVHAG